MTNANGHSNGRTSVKKPNPMLSDSVMRMFNMTGKVTIITGGTGGIGREVARGLAEAGSDIALWSYQSAIGEKLAASITRDYGVRCKVYRCDVSNSDEVGPQVGQLDIQLTMLRYTRLLMPSSKTLAGSM